MKLTMRTAWVSFAVLMILPIGAHLAAQEPDGSQRLQMSSEFDPIKHRWRRLPPMELRIRAEPDVGRIHKPADQSIWDRATWAKTSFVFGADVVVRIHGDKLSADFSFDDSATSRLRFSHIDGEFVELIGTENKELSGHIMAARSTNRLAIDNLFLALEQQFFDIQEPWSTIIDRFEFRKRGEDRLEGHDCWRLESTASQLEADQAHLAIWVSPELDYCPVRATFTINPGGKNRIDKEMRAIAHRRVGLSWIVESAMTSLTAENQDYIFMSSYRVQALSTGDQYAPASVRTVFPKGTRVTDLVQSEHWTADGQGGREGIAPLDTREFDALAGAVAAQIDRPAMKKARNTGLLGIALGTLVVVGILVVVKRRVHN